MCRFDLVAARCLHPDATTRCSLVRGNPTVRITMNDLPNMRHANVNGSYAAHGTCALKRNDAQFVYTCRLREDFCWIELFLTHKT
jgi:hypothetical protein